MSNFLFGSAGLTLLDKWEQLRLCAYKDSGGVLTVGYGHTGPDVIAGMACTVEDANRWRDRDLAPCVKAVNDGISVPISQSQFDSLVVLTYNIGRGGFHGSDLRAAINRGESAEACAPLFLHFTTAGGVHSPGLVNRREAEMALFES